MNNLFTVNLKHVLLNSIYGALVVCLVTSNFSISQDSLDIQQKAIRAFRDQIPTLPVETLEIRYPDSSSQSLVLIGLPSSVTNWGESNFNAVSELLSNFNSFHLQTFGITSNLFEFISNELNRMNKTYQKFNLYEEKRIDNSDLQTLKTCLKWTTHLSASALIGLGAITVIKPNLLNNDLFSSISNRISCIHGGLSKAAIGIGAVYMASSTLKSIVEYETINSVLITSPNYLQNVAQKLVQHLREVTADSTLVFVEDLRLPSLKLKLEKLLSTRIEDADS